MLCHRDSGAGATALPRGRQETVVAETSKKAHLSTATRALPISLVTGCFLLQFFGAFCWGQGVTALPIRGSSREQVIVPRGQRMEFLSLEPFVS